MTQVFDSALEKTLPTLLYTSTHVESARRDLKNFLNENMEFVSLTSVTLVVSDPREEFDDLAMLRYGVYNTVGDVVVVLSNGYFTSQERLNYLIEMFPCFQGAKLGETMETAHGGHILFLEDGELVPYTIKRFINCGPCSSRTLKSIQFGVDAIVVTVGANVDGTSASGINQMQTDIPGKLVKIYGVWNEFIDRAICHGARISNISVTLSRYVLFPNPLQHKGISELASPSILNAMIKTTAMFISSRPPPQYGLRVNEGNSVVDIQLYNKFDPTMEEYKQGLKKIEEYMELAKSKGLAEEYYESAAIPIMVTYCMGGVYKEGVFGFSPTDKEAKETISCLTPESAERLVENIKKLKYLTPGYDPLAYIEAFK